MIGGSLTGIHQLSDNVWRLGAHHLPTFLVRDDGQAALFEVGHSASAALVLKQLDQMKAPREEVGWVALSHAHADHATGQEVLMNALPRAVLVMSQASQKYLAKPSTLAPFADEDLETSEKLVQFENLELDAPLARVTGLTTGNVEITQPGQILKVGQIEMELLDCPGHAPGALMGWLPQQGVLLASDSAGYVVNNKPHWPLYFVSYSQYMDTLAMITEMDPEVLAPGHQQYFTGQAVGRYLSDLTQYLRDFHLDIRRRIKTTPAQTIAQEMFDAYYHDELRVFPADSILDCCSLLVKRSLEEPK